MMEAVVAVAIGILTFVFVGSLMALILVCRHKYCQPLDLISRQFKDARPEIHLINDDDDAADMELDDVRVHPNIEKILTDEQWVDDATGLIPHCLAILKKCHHLTERLVAVMMTTVSQDSPQQIAEIIEVAKKISPRVDDVVRSMYPPLDPPLLEARCRNLILSVTHLALITKSVCHIQSTFNWIEEALTDMEENLQVLRKAGLALEINTPSPTVHSITHSGGIIGHAEGGRGRRKVSKHSILCEVNEDCHRNMEPPPACLQLPDIIKRLCV